VIVEKPFGHDLESAIQLNKELKEILSEKQIYRIDHYLGKETVQNVMVFRFANSIIEPLWNRTYIDHVQITRPRPSVWNIVEHFTRRQARCATWYRIIFFNS